MKNSLKRSLLRFMSGFILIVLPSCSQKKPIALVLLKDTSISGQNNEEFQTTTKKACKSITESISRGDQFKVIQVNG
ncbi:MAG: hypothetical protein ACKPHT_08200, partial [Microcystis panniformis]